MLGLRPTELLCQEATAVVMNNMVDFMKAPKDEVEAVYKKHLALLVSTCKLNVNGTSHLQI